MWIETIVVFVALLLGFCCGWYEGYAFSERYYKRRNNNKWRVNR